MALQPALSTPGLSSVGQWRGAKQGLWITGSTAKPQRKQRKMANVEVRAKKEQVPVAWAPKLKMWRGGGQPPPGLSAGTPSALRGISGSSHQEQAHCPSLGVEGTGLEIQKNSQVILLIVPLRSSCPATGVWALPGHSPGAWRHSPVPVGQAPLHSCPRPLASCSVVP